MKALVINNLKSGLHDGAIFEFIRKFARGGDSVMMRCIDEDIPVAGLLDDAQDYDLVVASGGDGTISAVCYELRDTKIPILPFPAGTANLLATNLDMPDEPSAIATMARELRTLDFDIAELTYTHDDTEVTSGFALIAGAGYDATIMETAGNLKEAFGPGAYFAAAFVNPNPVHAHFTITLDDEVIETKAIAVLVLNFAKIYPDISITHDNNARDGLLEIAVIKPNNAVELLPALLAAFLDRDGGFPSRTKVAQTFRSKTVRVQADPSLHLQYDGEAPGAQTPFSARILPLATRLVVSEHTYERFAVEKIRV